MDQTIIARGKAGPKDTRRAGCRSDSVLKQRRAESTISQDFLKLQHIIKILRKYAKLAPGQLNSQGGPWANLYIA
jgi:hypothetical protein